MSLYKASVSTSNDEYMFEEQTSHNDGNGEDSHILGKLKKIVPVGPCQVLIHPPLSIHLEGPTIGIKDGPSLIV